MKKLKPRWKAFADSFIESGNMTDAAIKAGYSEKYARAQSYKLLENVCIAEYIAERTRPTEEKRIASGDEVMEYLSKVMRGEIKDQFGLEASLADRTKAAVELAKRTVDIEVKNNIGTNVAENMKTLADILLNSRPNRNLQDFE